MPSFDIVSRLDMAEVDNALAGLTREVTTRYDFKDSKSSVTRQESNLVILADDELKLRQLHELLKMHLTRRKVDAGALEFKPAEKASGNMQRQTVVLKQGVDRELYLHKRAHAPRHRHGRGGSDHRYPRRWRDERAREQRRADRRAHAPRKRRPVTHIAQQCP